MISSDEIGQKGHERSWSVTS